MWQLAGQNILYLVLAALAGLIVGGLLARTATMRRVKKREAELESSLQTAEHELSLVHNEKGAIAARVAKLESELATAQTLLRAREAALTEQIAKLKEQELLKSNLADKDAELTRLRWRLSELEQRYGATGNLPFRNGPRVPYERDDLRQIRGVGAVYADLLNRMNIVTFRQVAQWTEEDVQRVSELLGEYPDRIKREDWMGHAREQHFLKYGERI